MLATLRQTLMLGVLVGAWSSAWADIYVIVNASNPIKSLAQKEVVDIFMGRTRMYPSGEYVLSCDLPRDNGNRSAFYQTLTGMSQAQLNSYWSRLMFTGQVMPPQLMPNEQTMLDMVRRNPGAIGYVGQEPVDKGVRVVLTVKEAH